MPIPPHPRRDEAIKLLRQGKSVAEVVETTRASRRAVQQWARLEGLARRQGPRDPSPQTQEILRRLAEGDRPPQIAADLGVSASWVRQVRASAPTVTKETCA